MAVKTITIDTEAYDLLAAQKVDNESFSRVIKRRLGHAHTARSLLSQIQDITLAGQTLDTVEHIIVARKASPASSPALGEK